MPAEISYDLVMGPDMGFVEGTYRLNGGDWQVFVFVRRDLQEPVIKHCRFAWSGISGILVKVPEAMVLNQAVVEQIMSQACEVDKWNVVRGPDSMKLR